MRKEQFHKVKLGEDWQHGDVQGRAIDKIPEGLKLKPVEDGVLAWGEATGHCHKVAAPRGHNGGRFAEVLVDEENPHRQFIRALLDDVQIRHDKSGAWTKEHDTLVLPKGQVYEISPTHEYDYETEENRRVMD